MRCATERHRRLLRESRKTARTPRPETVRRSATAPSTAKGAACPGLPAQAQSALLPCVRAPRDSVPARRMTTLEGI